VSADAKALAAYCGTWNAYATAGAVADPTHGDLAQYTTGDALSALTKGLDGYREKGQVMKVRPVMAPPGDRTTFAFPGRRHSTYPRQAQQERLRAGSARWIPT
jgi:hypothetical protein